MRIWLGTDLAAKENNSFMYAQQGTATVNMDVPGKSEVTFITKTSAICNNRASTGGGGAANTVIDADTLIDTDSSMKSYFEANILAGDTVHLLEISIVWEA